MKYITRTIVIVNCGRKGLTLALVVKNVIVSVIELFSA